MVMWINMQLLDGLLLLFGLFVTVIAVPSTDLEEWNAFKLKYGKTYQNETEEKFRMEIFLKNKHKIEEHNQQFKNGSVTYEMGLNEYSVLLDDEFMIQMANKFDKFDVMGSTAIDNETMIWNDCNFFFNGSHKSNFSRNHHHIRYFLHLKRDNLYEMSDLPFSIDWRDEGAVNVAVPFQGINCHSHSIFASTGAIEGQYFRKTGKLVQLSKQNIIDCSADCACNGCRLADAYKYVMENEGIQREALYPYKGSKSFCKYRPNDSDIKIHGCMRIPRGDEDKLKIALATIGPISVSFNFSPRKFFQYTSGIYYDPECNNRSMKHSVLLVGYGTTKKGEDYYIGKNWWGHRWGEGGYFKIARNRDNHCGIASEAVYPVL